MVDLLKRLPEVDPVNFSRSTNVHTGREHLLFHGAQDYVQIPFEGPMARGVLWWMLEQLMALEPAALSRVTGSKHVRFRMWHPGRCVRPIDTPKVEASATTLSECVVRAYVAMMEARNG